MTVTIQEARGQLAELIRAAAAGTEVVITENDQAVARLVPAGNQARFRSCRTAGGGQSSLPAAVT